MTELPVCPTCGSSTDSARMLKQLDCPNSGNGSLSVRIVECPECGHVFLNPQPSSEELAPYYQADYHVFADPLDKDSSVDRLIAAKLHGDRLNHALVVKGGRYLDIGCGLGEMVAAMARLGVEAEGVEPGARAVERARGLGSQVFHGTLEQARYPDETFDCVTLYHVLEHAPDPVALLTECRRILKPTGEIFVGVPNFESMTRRWVGWGWGAIDAPRHLHHFRAEPIRRAVERAGLHVVRIHTESFPEHIELDLAMNLRRRCLVPARITLKTGLVRPLARYLATKGSANGHGEALNLHLRK
jgi:2-polyprenyl-3-methyl-5-hydroxy-6-metoxy-1,4-benzoquinol methylase